MSSSPTKPDCPCWQDPELMPQRENVADHVGAAMMEMFRLNLLSQSYCPASWAYVAGAAFCSMAMIVAWGRTPPDAPITKDAVRGALDEIYAMAQERAAGSRTNDLDNLPVEGTA